MASTSQVFNIPPPDTKNSVEQTADHLKNRRKLILIVTAFFLVIAAVTSLFPLLISNQAGSVSVSDRTKQPIPTPMPFFEMTIPGLRAREYESSLGERALVSENSLYTSYLTSFDSDGLKVNGLLTIPVGDPSPQQNVGTQDDSRKYPAIIFIHGYISPTLYQTTSQYADYVDYLARNGFVVFKIDLRGHGASEGEAGGSYYGSDYIVDALNARAALQDSGFVKPGAIGIWGHSMSGNIVMRSFAAMPDIPAIAIWAGAVYTYQDMQKYGIDDNSYRPPSTSNVGRRRRTELFEKYGSPSAQSVFWQQVAPTNYLGDLRGAIEIHHAVDDPVVNIGYSRDLMALLDATNVPHQLFEYPSGGHNITGASFTLAMQRTVDFFRKYLK